ncbi:hypothetical protein H0H81_001848 [Sphagnurus paluster]|uniref:Methyltransferase type 11 domain-containing protein n=1 Tax=Sphagnurus paluster TaxID=117069 RepID=A0A9P7FSB3_9AGAR|nr:hypothetical protein H0H81_001848 [Sphagnurus paluster]
MSMASEVPQTAEGFAEANRTHFDAIAHKYDDSPHAIVRSRRTAAKIREFYPFDEETTTIMEYACGTGLVSRELAPYVRRIVGVDISQGMVDQFNLRVNNQGIQKEEMEAFCAELKGEPGELRDEKFDVVVCASAYHHFKDISDVTRILAYFLKPGGALLVVDLATPEEDQAHPCQGQEYTHGNEHMHEHTHGNSHNPDQGHEHGHGHMHGPLDDHTPGSMFPESVHHIVPHRGGLSEQDMRQAFERAGLVDFRYDRGIVAQEDRRLFIAKGVKRGGV